MLMMLPRPCRDIGPKAGFGEEEDAGHVDIVDALEVGQAERLSRFNGGDAGVVEQDIEAAQSLNSLVHRALRVLLAPDISAQSQRLHAQRLKLLGCALCRVQVDVNDGDVGTVLSQSHGHRLAQPTPSAGDERIPPREVEHIPICHWDFNAPSEWKIEIW